MRPLPTTSIVLAWCLAFAAFSTAWCWSAAWSLGPTFDEPLYLERGLTCWRERSQQALLVWGTMPLPPEVQTAPLYLLDVLDPDRDLHADPLPWLPIARMVSVLFWWLLLWASYRLAAIYGGPAAGCLAVALIACEPILLGHATLATTDLPFAACLVQALASFRSRRDRPAWAGRLLAPACWVALTFLAKASALVFVPICLIAIEAERLVAAGWTPPDGWRTLRAALLDLLVLAGLGAALLTAVSPGAWGAIAYQVSHNAADTPTHLFGALSMTGFRHYFAAALAIKFGLPVLILIAVALVLGPRGFLNGAMAAAICLLAATPLFRVQYGVRFVLAIGILATIGAAAALARWQEHAGKVPRNIACAFAGCLVAASLTTSIAVWPNGMCYVNPLFGGPSGGFRVLSESNCDWGQGLPELARWHEEHADAPLSLWYFGTDPAAGKPPFQPVELRDAIDADQVSALVAGHYLAASSTHLFTYYPRNPASVFLRSLRPCGMTSTYLIYDFRHVDPETLPYVKKRQDKESRK